MVQMQCVSVKQYCNQKFSTISQFEQKCLKSKFYRSIIVTHSSWSSLLAHKVLLEKLLIYGLDEQISGLKTENRRAQRLVVCRAKSHWRPVTSALPPGLELCPVLFNGFITKLGDGAQCLLSRFADMTELEVKDGKLEDHTAFQWDLSMLEKWPDLNYMSFVQEKCQVLQLGRNNPLH